MARYELVSCETVVHRDNTQASVGVVCREGKLETRQNGYSTRECPVLAACQATLSAIAKFEGRPHITIRVLPQARQNRVVVEFRGGTHSLCEYSGRQAEARTARQAVGELIKILNEPWEEAAQLHVAAK